QHYWDATMGQALPDRGERLEGRQLPVFRYLAIPRLPEGVQVWLHQFIHRHHQSLVLLLGQLREHLPAEAAEHDPAQASRYLRGRSAPLDAAPLTSSGVEQLLKLLPGAERLPSQL